MTSMGTFRLTFYCGCEQCCGEHAADRPVNENGETIVYGAYGRELIAGYSCASNGFEDGTKLFLEGFGEVQVDDRTSDWVHDKYVGRVVDVYCNDHDEANFYREALGDYVEVFV